MATFIASMPDGYVLSTPEEMLPAHGELRRRLAEREAAGERPALTTQLVDFPSATTASSPSARATGRASSRCCPACSRAHGMNILAARSRRATTTWPSTRSASRTRTATAGRTSSAGSASSGRCTPCSRATSTSRSSCAARARPSILTRRRRPVPTHVEIDNRVSRDYTVLDVYTGDRVGLLFTITNCLYHLWLEIHIAKITTMVDQVLDVFYVTDNEGRKIENPAQLEVIRGELIRALEAEEAPVARAAGT
jgi:hypothetical protein